MGSNWILKFRVYDLKTLYYAYYYIIKTFCFITITTIVIGDYFLIFEKMKRDYGLEYSCFGLGLLFFLKFAYYYWDFDYYFYLSFEGNYSIG